MHRRLALAAGALALTLVASADVRAVDIDIAWPAMPLFQLPIEPPMRWTYVLSRNFIAGLDENDQLLFRDSFKRGLVRDRTFMMSAALLIPTSDADPCAVAAGPCDDVFVQEKGPAGKRVYFLGIIQMTGPDSAAHGKFPQAGWPCPAAGDDECRTKALGKFVPLMLQHNDKHFGSPQ